MKSCFTQSRYILGYEGFYKIYQDGTIYRLKDGSGIAAGKPLTPCIDWKGYLYVKLYKYGMRKSHKIHKLVAETWIGKRKKGLQINHKDGNKKNNHIYNLEYVTAKQNINHAIRLGLRPQNMKGRWRKKHA